MKTPVVIEVDATLAGHIATAIGMHLRMLRGSYQSPPDGLEDLAHMFTKRARQRHTATDLDDLARLVQAGVVTPRLLTYGQTADALSCSERQVQRLVSQGSLPAVHIGGLARIRVTDLDEFLHSLTPSTTQGDIAA